MGIVRKLLDGIDGLARDRREGAEAQRRETRARQMQERRTRATQLPNPAIGCPVLFKDGMSKFDY
jgi:hypothetical protein